MRGRRASLLPASVMMAGAIALGAARTAWCAAPPPPDPPADPAAQEGFAREAGEGVDWARLRIAPVGIWGSLAYDLRQLDAQTQADGPQDRSMQQLLTARLDAASYLWQPWFATVNGALGLTMGWNDGAAGAPASRDQFASGRAQLNLFPGSRFPFEAHVDVTDTRIDSGLVALPPARWTRWGLSQSFRPVGGAYSLYGSFDRVTQDSREFGTDTQDSLSIHGETRWKSNNLVVNANYSRNSRERTGEDLEFESVVGRHSYLPSPELSIESTANVTRNRYGLGSGDSENRVLQYTGIGHWRPLKQPFTLTATGRIFAADSTDGGGSRSANVTIGGNYDINRNLRLTASAGLGALSTAGSRQLVHAETAGVSYQGDSIELGKFRYDWNASANVGFSGRSGSAGGTAREFDEPDEERNLGAATAAFGHSVGRTFVLAEGSTIAAVVQQTLGGGKSTAERDGTGDRVRLGHTGSLTWSAGGSTIAGYARISATDSRDLVVRNSVFQMVNAQVSGTWAISRHGQLNGDLTAQWVRSENPPRLPTEPGALAEPGSRTATTGLSANIAFRHQRVFGVPRLRFLSELRITDDSVVEQDALALLPDRETRSWENRLDYAIGRLLVSLRLRLSEVNRNQVRLLMLRVQRDFEGVAGW